MSYADQLKRFKEMHEKEATKQWRAAMLEVMTGTIMDTPVLDGYLRGGWAAYLGTAGIGGLVPDKSGSIAMKQVSSAVSRAVLGADVWFVNRYPVRLRYRIQWPQPESARGYASPQPRQMESTY